MLHDQILVCGIDLFITVDIAEFIVQKRVHLFQVVSIYNAVIGEIRELKLNAVQLVSGGVQVVVKHREIIVVQLAVSVQVTHSVIGRAGQTAVLLQIVSHLNGIRIIQDTVIVDIRFLLQLCFCALLDNEILLQCTVLIVDLTVVVDVEALCELLFQKNQIERIQNTVMVKIRKQCLSAVQTAAAKDILRRQVNVRCVKGVLPLQRADVYKVSPAPRTRKRLHSYDHDISVRTLQGTFRKWLPAYRL